jgi:hypothetical protein
MASVPLAYELLAEIFKFYVSFQDTSPETLLQVCRSWNAVASQESALWTKFVISDTMVRSLISRKEDHRLTHDWVGIFQRRLARAGPSIPLQIYILILHELLLPVIDVLSGGEPGYAQLPRWETLDMRTFEMIVVDSPWGGSWPGIANLISQPMPSLRRLTLQQNKIDFHAFPNAPNLQELNVLYSRSPLIGQRGSFPNLTKIHITYPSKYPLSLVQLGKFSLGTIETLIIGGEVEFGENAEGTYPSLSTLEFTERVSRGIVCISAPRLRHLILRNADLFCLVYPPPDGEDQRANPQSKNKEVLGRLARAFPTVEVLEVHHGLRNLVSEMVSNDAVFFTGLKELRTVSEAERREWGLTYE